MKLLDPADPFFRPIWRRRAVVIAPALWAAFELYSGNPGWALLFGAAAGYAGWMLLGPGNKAG